MLSDIGGSIKFAQNLTLAEQHIYGSARHGMYTPDRLLARFHFSITDTLQIAMDSFKFVQSTTRFMRVVTYKQYELSNHLGNVLSTVYDRRTPIEIGGGNHTIKYFEADVIFATDYYPFGSGENYTKTGSSKAGRYYSYTAYRYGFNNQEKDGEMGEYYSFEYRVHDARLGRFLSVDPKSIKYPEFSSYLNCADNPNLYIDPDGQEIKISNFVNQTDYGRILKLMLCNEALLVNQCLKQFTTANKHMNFLMISAQEVAIDNKNGTYGMDSPNFAKAPAQTIQGKIGENDLNDIVLNQYASFYTIIPTENAPNADYSMDIAFFKSNDLALTVNLIHEIYFHAKDEVNGHIISTDQFDEAFKALKDFSTNSLSLALSDEVLISVLLPGILKQLNVDEQSDLISRVNTKYSLSLDLKKISKTNIANTGSFLFIQLDELKDACLEGPENMELKCTNTTNSDGTTKTECKTVQKTQQLSNYQCGD